MRKLIRSAAPQILADNCDKWNAQWKQRKTEKPSAPFNWYQHDKKSARDWIIDDLSAMTLGHCSFCDRYTVEPDSVEHFRPKSDVRFLDQAYSWENLFFCCGGCQTHKLERWDDRLINPDAADYVFLEFFEFDFTTGAISPNSLASSVAQDRASVTIQIYGLDTQQRRRWRLDELARYASCNDLSIDAFAYRDFIAEPPS